MRTRAEQIQLLEKRIAESGLSSGKFADLVLHREARTIRRWLSGDSPIPRKVLDWLEDPTSAPWP